MQKRQRFSKNFKYGVLLKIRSGMKPFEALIEAGYDKEELEKKDKNYASKMIHKWKIELDFENRMLKRLQTDASNEAILQKIKDLSDDEDDEEDSIMTEFKNKFDKKLFF